MEEVLRLEGISKQYTLATQRPVLLKNLFWPSKKERFWALKNIDLAVKKGEVLGIIGENGSGKSTLLKILAGITTPTGGKMQVKGRVASLIELGAGFHPDLTGRENIYLNAALMGLTRAEIDSKIKDIITFADIGEFIDSPVRTYSSGMNVRLGFAVAIHLDPDILLIDEVLAVGDETFQRKCLGKINAIKRNEKNIVMVSHDLSLIRDLSDRVVWIERGQIKKSGKPLFSIKSYLKKIEDVSKKFHTNKNRKKELFISDVTFEGKSIDKNVFSSNDPIKITIGYNNRRAINSASFGIAIYDELGKRLSGSSSEPLSISKKSGQVKVTVNKNSISDGQLYFTFAISSPDKLINYDWIEKGYSLRVKTNKNYSDTPKFGLQWMKND